ncbi:unnamed protein product [Protopolystoma xenopodis]|uniref:Uncharacterized protein n=1 Tax=Protopolystoma xenopodis TaxID=117903 RepID=A0A3S4ZXS4_9PLAT|nr:unnamed protein product [Protopolystoma xenopodis]
MAQEAINRKVIVDEAKTEDQQGSPRMASTARTIQFPQAQAIEINSGLPILIKEIDSEKSVNKREAPSCEEILFIDGSEKRKEKGEKMKMVNSLLNLAYEQNGADPKDSSSGAWINEQISDEEAVNKGISTKLSLIRKIRGVFGRQSYVSEDPFRGCSVSHSSECAILSKGGPRSLFTDVSSATKEYSKLNKQLEDHLKKIAPSAHGQREKEFSEVSALDSGLDGGEGQQSCQQRHRIFSTKSSKSLASLRSIHEVSPSEEAPFWQKIYCGPILARGEKQADKTGVQTQIRLAKVNMQ